MINIGYSNVYKREFENNNKCMDESKKKAGNALANSILGGVGFFLAAKGLTANVGGLVPHAVMIGAGVLGANELIDYMLESEKMDKLKEERDEIFEKFAYYVYKKKDEVEEKVNLNFNDILDIENEVNPATKFQEAVGDAGRGI